MNVVTVILVCIIWLAGFSIILWMLAAALLDQMGGKKVKKVKLWLPQHHRKLTAEDFIGYEQVGYYYYPKIRGRPEWFLVLRNKETEKWTCIHNNGYIDLPGSLTPLYTDHTERPPGFPDIDWEGLL